MVLVRMRQHETHEIVALLLEKADVRHDQVDPRQMLFVPEGYAEIDREPAPLLAVAEAIDRQIHADLADSAERRKGQFIRPCHQLVPLDAAEPK
jgi:hypothetical protein